MGLSGVSVFGLLAGIHKALRGPTLRARPMETWDHQRGTILHVFFANRPIRTGIRRVLSIGSEDVEQLTMRLSLWSLTTPIDHPTNLRLMAFDCSIRDLETGEPVARLPVSVREAACTLVIQRPGEEDAEFVTWRGPDVGSRIRIEPGAYCIHFEFRYIRAGLEEHWSPRLVFNVGPTYKETYWEGNDPPFGPIPRAKRHPQTAHDSSSASAPPLQPESQSPTMSAPDLTTAATPPEPR